MTGSPSIVPDTSERDIYLVLDDFGSLLGQAWREAGEDDTERLTLVANLLDGQYHNPTRIIAFNTAEGWSRDVSEDVADELAAALNEMRCLPLCSTSSSGTKAPIDRASSGSASNGRINSRNQRRTISAAGSAVRRRKMTLTAQS
jgi:hypothetical protein